MILLVAPMVWTAHFVAVYVLVSLVCSGAPDLQRLVPWGVALATAAALAYFLFAGLASYRRARAAGEGASGFLASTSVLLCGLSGVATLWVAFPAFVLPACTS